jgi:hypothetical protein
MQGATVATGAGLAIAIFLRIVVLLNWSQYDAT